MVVVEKIRAVQIYFEYRVDRIRVLCVYERIPRTLA